MLTITESVLESKANANIGKSVEFVQGVHMDGQSINMESVLLILTPFQSVYDFIYCFYSLYLFNFLNYCMEFV